MLLRSIIVLCRIDNILKNIPHIQSKCEIFCKILLVPQNIVMDLSNVMLGKLMVQNISYQPTNLQLLGFPAVAIQ